MTKSKFKHLFITVGFLALVCCINLSAAVAGVTREYFVAAEDVVWDYAPSGQNLVNCLGQPAPCAIPQPWTNSHVFNKTRYIEYTNETFTVKKPQAEWLGILGPIIRAEVGDKVIVHFCNNSTYGALGMHPHGFRYTKKNEGADYYGVNSGAQPGAGAQIAPGDCFDYKWIADKDSGPAKGGLSSKVWWYHSHINEPAETNAGLLGPIIITRKGATIPRLVRFGMKHMTYCFKIVSMPTRSFTILQKLVENAGRVQSRARLEGSIYSWKNDVESNALEVHIHNIRKRFGSKFIRTIRGVGL